MGMTTRQEKALELRDLVTKINAIVAELQEDDCTIVFSGTTKGRYSSYSYIKGMIGEVVVERKYNL